jgi:hypothetical protein
MLPPDVCSDSSSDESLVSGVAALRGWPS